MTVPLGYVERWNKVYGQADTAAYGSLLVVADKAESLHRIATAIEGLGGQIAPAYELARKASLGVAGATFFLLGIAGMLLLLALAGILQTFALAAHERARDIGILRVVGATRRAIATIFVAEALLLRVTGSGIGSLAAWIVMRGADLALARWIPPFPFKPDSLFHTPWWIPAIASLATILACAIAAWGPARRAAAAPPLQSLTDS